MMILCEIPSTLSFEKTTRSKGLWYAALQQALIFLVTNLLSLRKGSGGLLTCYNWLSRSASNAITLEFIVHNNTTVTALPQSLVKISSLSSFTHETDSEGEEELEERRGEEKEKERGKWRGERGQGSREEERREEKGRGVKERLEERGRERGGEEKERGK